jgi:hypothetical protein
MLRSEAVAQIEEWADEAENGNYHDFSAVLRVLAESVKECYGLEVMTVIKSYDAYPPRNNIVELVIEDE